MSVSRRGALKLFGAGMLAATASTAAASCSLLGSSTPEPRLLPSTAKLPKPYGVPLPIPPVARPVSTTGPSDVYELEVKPAKAEIIPGLRTTIWGYGGTFPGPTFETRAGRPIVVDQRNRLATPISTHLHGGRVPASSDGYPTDVIKTGEERRYEYPIDQRAATLWYHDHRMDFTGAQVWRGLAGMFVVRDDEDDKLPLPKGDREIPLVICDRSFDTGGSLLYPSLDHTLTKTHGVKEAYAGGVLGDVILVNGAPWPQLEVDRARYRFRILNASNARTYQLQLDKGDLVQIGTDGGLLPEPQKTRTLTLAAGERADVVIDFAQYPVGGAVTLTNAAAEGTAGRVMRFRVARNAKDDSRIPAKLSTIEQLDPAKAKTTREFELASADLDGHTGWTINGEPFDPKRVDADPKLGTTEIWKVTSDIAHPIHLHLVHFQVLSIDGEKPGKELGWKDTLDVQAEQTVELIMRFDGYRGRYVFHCHNLEHEDMEMMSNFEVV
ncbi:multicopper oxidase family protein [Flindersiella endophytica]